MEPVIPSPEAARRIDPMSTANRIVVIVENGTVSKVVASDPNVACEEPADRGVVSRWAAVLKTIRTACTTAQYLCGLAWSSVACSSWGFADCNFPDAPTSQWRLISRRRLHQPPAAIVLGRLLIGQDLLAVHHQPDDLAPHAV